MGRCSLIRRTSRGRYKSSCASFRESTDGTGRFELFYVAPAGALMRVLVTPGAPALFSVPSRVLDGPDTWRVTASAGRLYDVSRKNGRFLMMKSKPDQPSHNIPDTIVVVQNWIEELKQKVPAR
jgi:hypothetical protein